MIHHMAETIGKFGHLLMCIAVRMYRMLIGLPTWATDLPTPSSLQRSLR